MKRWIKLVIAVGDIVPVYVGGRWCRSTCPYPADTKVVDQWWDESEERIVLILEHPTFPEVDPERMWSAWNKVEPKMSEEPRFGFFLTKEWGKSDVTCSACLTGKGEHEP